MVFLSRKKAGARFYILRREYYGREGIYATMRESEINYRLIKVHQFFLREVMVHY